VAELYAASHLGAVERKMMFESFETCEKTTLAFRAAQDWVDSLVRRRMERQGMLFFGPQTGCGKTHLACACANRLIQAGTLTVFMRTVLIPRHDQNAVLDLADPTETPVLILDDLGAEKPTPRLLECLYTIVECRLGSGAPTIVTTNLRPEGIRGYGTVGGYGDKLYSRLMQMCECVPVDGPDRRLKCTGR